MAGLVEYGSSDEEETVGISVAETSTLAEVDQAPRLKLTDNQVNGNPELPRTQSRPLPASEPGHIAPIGPSSAPAQPLDAEPTSQSRSNSPYTTNRNILRTLTLPENPNLDIPPSPPGSPAPGTDTKISQFLKLKAQGVHFNTKLAFSSALKNPSLLPKLMAAAGLEGEGGEDVQYTTSLPQELWDPSGFPAQAYTEELDRFQKEGLKAREEERLGREREFVPENGDRVGGATQALRAGVDWEQKDRRSLWDEKGPKGRK